MATMGIQSDEEDWDSVGSSEEEEDEDSSELEYDNGSGEYSDEEDSDDEEGESEESEGSEEESDDDEDTNEGGLVDNANESKTEQTDSEMGLLNPRDDFQDERVVTDDSDHASEIGCCVCCVILIALGIVLGLVLRSNDEDVPTPSMPPPPTPRPGTALSPAPSSLPSSRPTPFRFPTISPIPSEIPFTVSTSVPTPFPTMGPTISAEPTKIIPDKLEIVSFADTTIVKDNTRNLQLKSFGDDDTLLVQNGLTGVPEVPDAYFIFAFNMEEVPTFDRIQDSTNFAILRLTHVASALDRGPATLNLVRLPSTSQDIETLHAGIFVPSDGIDGPEFQVSPSDIDIDIDISELLFGTPVEDDQLLLMVENRGPEQEEGDRFWSRESDFPPLLQLDFVAEGQPLPTRPPSSSIAPTHTILPTIAPSLSASTGIPISSPTMNPLTLSPDPISPTPTLAPSISTSAPMATLIPTTNPPSLTPSLSVSAPMATLIPTTNSPSLAPSFSVSTPMATLMPTTNPPSLAPSLSVPTPMATSIPTTNPSSLAPSFSVSAPMTTLIPTTNPSNLAPSPIQSVLPTTAPSLSIPTLVPTTVPTTNPSNIPEPTNDVADQFELVAVADTTIIKDGAFQFESFGNDDTLLVQDGLANVSEIPDAYFIFAFDLSEVPTFDRMRELTNTAVLRLTHVASALDRGPATLNLVRLPSTRLAILERLHGGIFVPSNGIEGPEFQVSPSDTDIDIDISELLFGTPVEDDQLFLMIENRGPEQEEGDRFWSRESDFPPLLLLDFVAEEQSLPSEPPTSSLAPTHTILPTSVPSLSVPTTIPTTVPTTNPSNIPEPTNDVADQFELVAVADTTIFKDGAFQFESFGNDDTLLVQDGLADASEIPDAYFIFTFDMNEVPTFDRMQELTNTAVLRLTHVASALDRGPATLNLVRLPSTRLNIERLNGGLFVPSNGIEGPEFQVSPSDTSIDIDISELLFSMPVEDDQLLLMVENRGPEQESGDKFWSRESDFPPLLLLDFASTNDGPGISSSPAFDGGQVLLPGSDQFQEPRQFINDRCAVGLDIETCIAVCKGFDCCDPFLPEEESCLFGNREGCLNYARCHVTNFRIDPPPQDLDFFCSPERIAEDPTDCESNCMQATCCWSDQLSCVAEDFYACLDYASCQNLRDDARVFTADPAIYDICGADGSQGNTDCEDACAAAECCWADGADNCLQSDFFSCLTYEPCKKLELAPFGTSLTAPRADIGVLCSFENVNNGGAAECESACSGGNCCIEGAVDNCFVDDPLTCLQYDVCKIVD